MSDPFKRLPRHRKLVAFLETALDALEEAVTLDELCVRVARECPHLSPLSAEEWGEDAAEEDG